MIRKLKSGEYRLYSRKIDPKTGRRRNLGTFATRVMAEKHEREVQYFNAAGKSQRANGCEDGSSSSPPCLSDQPH
jgi:hypothetical protein